MFSFLESSEPHGLRDHLQGGDGRLYCLHDLYDYLLGSIGEALYVQTQGKRWAEIETVLARLPQATALDIALVKTVGLLGAMGQWRNLLATEKILRFALYDTPPRDYPSRPPGPQEQTGRHLPPLQPEFRPLGGQRHRLGRAYPGCAGTRRPQHGSSGLGRPIRRAPAARCQATFLHDRIAALFRGPLHRPRRIRRSRRSSPGRPAMARS